MVEHQTLAVSPNLGTPSQKPKSESDKWIHGFKSEFKWNILGIEMNY
jgi:hypothetical protein